MPTLNLRFVNDTLNVDDLYAYLYGLDLITGDLYFLQSDSTLYKPSNPAVDGSPLGGNCAIPVGGPGCGIDVTMPMNFKSGRVYFSLNKELQFFLNRGVIQPGLATPSLTNTSDENINTLWDFMELTFDQTGVFANISYVDLVCVPIALDLETVTGSPQQVKGMDSTGITTVATELAKLATTDQPWDKLCVKDDNNKTFRIISPEQYVVAGPGKGSFAEYWDPYITSVWDHYSDHDLTINTQDQSVGDTIGDVQEGELVFQNPVNENEIERFQKPSSFDVFSCSTGPFDTRDPNITDFRKRIIALLAAAFNRSVLLLSDKTPNGTTPSQYYPPGVTNYYSKIVHAANLDKKGYGFPYDDVVPDGNDDVAGIVKGNPKLLTVSVGGKGNF